MKKLLPYVALIALLILAIIIYNTQKIAAQSAAWQPLRLRIPALSLSASVMPVGATSSGQMDAPTSAAVNSPYWTSVFWYKGGVAPGQEGNAVIAGHVDRVGGNPAVFWSLNTLKAGDQIFIETSGQASLKFVVDRVVSYSATAPTQEDINAVFGPSNIHHLNLITCSGTWVNGGYDQRLVVFTTQVS